MPRKPNHWIFLLLCSIFNPAEATTIHSWVDDDGVTHFSDAPPVGEIDGATTVEIDDNYPPQRDAQAEYYSIANQWNRMREEREAKNKLSLEKARIQAEKSAALAYTQPPVAQTGYRDYFPIYGFPGHRGNLRGRRFQDDRHTNFRRGPHHVQPGHGRLSHRSQNRARNSRFRQSHRGARHGGAGFRFGVSLN